METCLLLRVAGTHRFCKRARDSAEGRTGGRGPLPETRPGVSRGGTHRLPPGGPGLPPLRPPLAPTLHAAAGRAQHLLTRGQLLQTREETQMPDIDSSSGA
ncbi:hypothetical protein VULLAG_LOCUS983 [Vulpes lagopus]